MGMKFIVVRCWESAKDRAEEKPPARCFQVAPELAVFAQGLMQEHYPAVELQGDVVLDSVEAVRLAVEVMTTDKQAVLERRNRLLPEHMKSVPWRQVDWSLVGFDPSPR